MPLGDKTLQRLRDNDSNLTSLDLRNNQISDAGAKSLADALVNNSNLTSLFLYGNQLGAEGAKMLAEVLEKNTTLTLLDLSMNQLGAGGAKVLAGALEKNTALTSLFLLHNQLGAEGAKALAGVLEKNTTLTLLFLFHNQLGDEGAKALAGALEKNFTLTSLELRANQIGDALNKQIESLIERNQQYAKMLQARACEQLRLGRILLYKAVVRQEGESILSLPLKLREEIIKQIGVGLMAKEQERLILDYAQGKRNEKGETIVPPVRDKLSFFKATKCDRVMKEVKWSDINLAYVASVSLSFQDEQSITRLETIEENKKSNNLAHHGKNQPKCIMC